MLHIQSPLFPCSPLSVFFLQATPICRELYSCMNKSSGAPITCSCLRTDSICSLFHSLALRPQTVRLPLRAQAMEFSDSLKPSIIVNDPSGHHTAPLIFSAPSENRLYRIRLFMRIAVARIPAMLAAFSAPPVNNVSIFPDDSPSALNQATSRGSIATAHQADGFPEKKTAPQTKRVKKAFASGQAAAATEPLTHRITRWRPVAILDSPTYRTQLTRSGLNKKRTARSSLLLVFHSFFSGFTKRYLPVLHANGY